MLRRTPLHFSWISVMKKRNERRPLQASISKKKKKNLEQRPLFDIFELDDLSVARMTTFSREMLGFL
jgi:hypothetical protein